MIIKRVTRLLHTTHSGWVNQLLVRGLDEDNRRKYLQTLRRANVGERYLAYLSSVDLDYPTAAIKLNDNQLNGGYPLNSPHDFKDFLHRHYVGYLCESGRLQVKDPSWGMDPEDGLMSSRDIIRQCKFELQDLVEHYHRLADDVLRHGLNQQRQRRVLWGGLMDSLYRYSRGLKSIKDS